jgi:rhamnosyl/mannosyltransferase
MLQKFADKVRVIPFGVDLSVFCSPDQPAEIPSAGITGELKLLFVGRLVRYKGLAYLVSALKTAPGHLRVIGTGYLEDDLRKQVRALDLQGRVEFLGNVSAQELIAHYAEADVIVLPSIDRGEAFGYVLLEAMSCATAAISTNLGTGTSFVNLHNESGIVVAPRNVEALAAAICKLDQDRALLAQFKQAARNRVAELFDVRRMLKATKALYAELGLTV